MMINSEQHNEYQQSQDKEFIKNGKTMNVDSLLAYAKELDQKLIYQAGVLGISNQRVGMCDDDENKKDIFTSNFEDMVINAREFGITDENIRYTLVHSYNNKLQSFRDLNKADNIRNARQNAGKFLFPIDILNEYIKNTKTVQVKSDHIVEHFPLTPEECIAVENKGKITKEQLVNLVEHQEMLCNNICVRYDIRKTAAFDYERYLVWMGIDRVYDIAKIFYTNKLKTLRAVVDTILDKMFGGIDGKDSALMDLSVAEKKSSLQLDFTKPSEPWNSNKLKGAWENNVKNYRIVSKSNLEHLLGKLNEEQEWLTPDEVLNKYSTKLTIAELTNIGITMNMISSWGETKGRNIFFEGDTDLSQKYIAGCDPVSSDKSSLGTSLNPLTYDLSIDSEKVAAEQFLKTNTFPLNIETINADTKSEKELSKWKEGVLTVYHTQNVFIIDMKDVDEDESLTSIGDLISKCHLTRTVRSITDDPLNTATILPFNVVLDAAFGKLIK